MQPVPSTATKTYPQRGPLQQYRFAESVSFNCFRCGEPKRSKLITTYGGDWGRRLCNGCYGRLLSLYEIKAGTAPGDDRAEALADALLGVVATSDQREAESIFRAAEERASHLSPEALRFIVTAEHVADGLAADPQLEWSPAVIGLCKAIEIEVVNRILRPLAAAATSRDLSADRDDKDIGKVAGFCADPRRKAPELGAFAHFLQTVIHSAQRRETSPVIGCFLKLAADWPGSQWLLEPAGLHAALRALTTKFRNRAAHTDELGGQDYADCRDHVIGPEGALWRLIVATEPRRRTG